MTLSEELLPETFRESSTPVLETERLILRAPRPEDAAAIASLANDRRIAENTARIPFPYRLADAHSFIAAANASDDEMTFVITLGGEELMGACGIQPGDGSGPEIGYWLGAPYWGCGYATEAVRALIDLAFEHEGYEVLQAGARVTNPTSRRVLEKCGFQWTGVGLYRIRALGSSAPIDRFRLDRGIWASFKRWRPMRRVG